MKVLSVIGTRPEVIKMAPVIRGLEQAEGIESVVCKTGQHREMVVPLIDLFDIQPDYDLQVMEENQSLDTLTSSILEKLTDILESRTIDCVLVQGDTTSVLSGTLAASYQEIPVGHVEAGLRTDDMFNPFPEEINRRVADQLSTLHFAPTVQARDRLEESGFDESVYVTGNTVVDALKWILEQGPTEKAKSELEALGVPEFLEQNKEIVLVTAHRRESFGEGFRSMCEAMLEVAERNPSVELIYPVHLNPNVQEPVNNILKGHSRIHLVDPVSYETFVHLMNASTYILTDSGGIQEEAPSLGVPVLVMRETTERPEALQSGSVELVGRDREKIVNKSENLLKKGSKYREMSQVRDVFGDGTAANKIVEIISESI